MKQIFEGIAKEWLGWWCVDTIAVHTMFEPFEGKKVRITIEILEEEEIEEQ